MNLPHAMISTFLRRTKIAAAAAGVLLTTTSCTVFPPPDYQSGPPFTPDGRPRYGHNGTESPNHTDPRANNPRQPDIKRDPNNERVDITPPTPRSTTNSTDIPGVNPDPASSVASDPASAPQPLTPREDLPFGIPVVGKKGMVYSPYAPEKGVVDVENLKRGTRVRCPYTDKHFRVP